MERRSTGLIVVAACAAALSADCFGQGCSDEIAKLMRPNPQDSDFMGRSVGAGAGRIAVGAVQADGIGAVEMFQCNGQGWTHLQMLRPGDISPGDRFAEHCDLDGDVLVVGARWQNNETGAAYVYRFDGSLWRLEQKLTASDGVAVDTFGLGVAVEGDRMVIGANRAGGIGAAYVFEFDGAQWIEVQRLDPSDGATRDQFGWGVALSGEVIVVGANRHDGGGQDSGAAYVYRHDGSRFVEEQKLLASDGAAGDRFGLNVTIDGDRLVIGSHEHDLPDEDAGAAYVFRFDGSHWSEEQKLTASDGDRRHNFGFVPHLTGDRLLVTAPYSNDTGAVYVFERTDAGQWAETATLTPSDGGFGDSFGWALDDGGDFVVLGAYAHEGGGFLRGAAYVYACDSDTDGDGLLDDWEVNGVPFTAADGTQRRYLLDIDGDGVSDADPMRKDLFVEVDSMQGLGGLGDAARLMVVDAFANAPLDNPDGSTGITLHVLDDDQNLPFEELSPMGANGWPENVSDLAAAWFGTAAERADPDATALRLAKRKAVRYCMWMNRLDDPNGNIGGMAELAGDDFVLFDAFLTRGLAIDRAAVFMHELGHNLGLRHGGGDDTNGKPNYPSIMNYTLTLSRDWNSGFWELDYSREKLPTLDESCLDETAYAGSARYQDFWMPYYSLIPFGAACFDQSLWGQPAVRYLPLSPDSANDFDASCSLENCVEEDLNFFDQFNILPGAGEPSPGQKLEGHDDWANIVLPLSTGGGSGAFGGSPAPDELTDMQLAWMEDNFPLPPGACAADLDGDGDADVNDFFLYLDLFAAGDPDADVNGDGSVDVNDFFAYLDLFAAGC